MTRTLTLFAGIMLCIVSFQTFAQSYRLVGYRKNTFNTIWTPDDSSKLVYSNGRGGNYDDFFLRRARFDTSYNVNWNGTSFVPSSTEIKIYDQQNVLTESFLLDGLGVNYSHFIYSHDVNGNNTMNVSQTWQNNAWQNSGRAINTYDVNDNFIANEQEQWDNTNNVWKPWYKIFYDYDMNNNIIKHVRLQYNQGTSQYDSVEKSFYHYTNNLRDTTWNKFYMGTADQYKYVYTYQNGVKSMEYDYKLQSGWEPTYRTFSFYQGTDNIHIGDSTQSWSSGIWKDSYVSRYRIDNNNDAVSVFNKQVNVQTGLLENKRLDTFKYNNGHQRTWETGFDWDNNTSSFVPSTSLPENFYYYEQYTNDVEDISINTAKLQVFPSPARNDININVTFNEPEDFKVRIYDMQGRLVLQIGEKATKDYGKNIPLPELASGNYILQVAGKQTKAEQQFTIIK